MPELPDVQVMKEYMDATSLHQQIEDVEVRSQQMLEGVDAGELKDTLSGHTFAGTRRHGKYLFAALDGDGWLVLHFGMTGDLKYYKNPEQEPEYEQILFHFSNGYHLAYIMPRKLGEVALVDDPDDLIQEKQLGPDVLADDFDFHAFQELLGGRRGMIKSGLMDQQLMVGIGNVYSDEILFHAGIHPGTQVSDLSEDEMKRLFDCLQEVLQVAIKRRAKPDQFPDNYLTPHRGAEHECPRCGGLIKRTEVSGRPSYFCSQCQRQG